MMDVNVLRCSSPAARSSRRCGAGRRRIVNISSGTPFRGVPFLLHYVTSKGAIVALTRALAKELGKDEIQVNCVAPGFTMCDGVEEHPEVVEALQDISVAARTIQRDQVPEDVIGAVAFLCSPAPASSPARRWSSTAASTSIEALADEQAAPAVETRAGPPSSTTRATRLVGDGSSGSHALGWEVAGDEGGAAWPPTSTSPPGRWIDALDRIDFPPGGIAYRHAHPGPGIRRPAPRASSTIDAEGESSTRTARASRGSRRGPDPVLATRRRRAVRRSSACCSCRRSGPGSAPSATWTRPTRRSRRPSARRCSSSSRSRRERSGGRSSSTSSCCTAPISRSACPARATCPCSTRCTTHPSGSSCRHEAGAANMAEAYGKLTGRPGHLPRHARAGRDPGGRRRAHRLAGLDAADPARGPRAARVRRPRGLAGARLRGRVRGIAKAAWHVDDADRLPEHVARAFALATLGRPGPGRARAARGRARRRGRRPRRGARPAARRVAARRATRRACGAARGGRAPAGRSSARAAGRRGRAATSRVLRGERSCRSPRLPLPGLRRQPLAARTPASLGVAMDDRPRVAAPRRGLVLAIGGRLGEVHDRRYTLLEAPAPRQTLVHVHPDPGELGSVYQPGPRPIACGVPELRGRARRARADRAALAGLHEAARADYEANLRTSRWRAPVDLGEVMAALRERLPGPDAILTNGAGNFTVWAHRYDEFRRYGTQARARAAARWATASPAAVAAKARPPGAGRGLLRRGRRLPDERAGVRHRRAGRAADHRAPRQQRHVRDDPHAPGAPVPRGACSGPTSSTRTSPR